MSSVPRPKISVEEYLAMGRAAEVKSEFHDGQLFPVESPSTAHSRIAATAARSLDEKLSGTDCTVLGQPLHVRVSGTRFVYPDLLVVCGRPELTDEHQDTVTNSKVVIEILSLSTVNRDYGVKLQLYMELPNWAEYILIDQYEPWVEVFRRRMQGTDWLFSPTPASMTQCR